MFDVAPINQQLIKGAVLQVSQERAQLQLKMRNDFYHAAMSLHGAIYFKLLDDAAYFAAASAEQTYFLFTKSYKIHFRRPVSGGELKAFGQLVDKSGNEWVARSEIVNEDGKTVASGEGLFVKSKLLLEAQFGCS